MKYILLAVSLSVICSCSLYRLYREVRVCLPHDERWELLDPGETWYLVTWPDGTGGTARLHIDAFQGHFDITIPAGRDVPITSLICGRYPGPSGYISAGETGPVHLDPDLFDLMDLLVELSCAAPRRAEAVSIEYWVYSMEKLVAPSEDYGIHWEDIDREQVRIGILTGSTADPPVTLMDAEDVLVEALPPGRWILSGRPTQQFHHGGGDVLLRLPSPGMHQLECPEEQRILEIILDESGGSSAVLRRIP